MTLMKLLRFFVQWQDSSPAGVDTCSEVQMWMATMISSCHADSSRRRCAKRVEFRFSDLRS